MLVGDGKPGAWCWGICFWENIGGIWGVSAWTMPLSWPENNAPILDNQQKKCYNKCNDDNKKVISHQTGKNAPVRRFATCPYKITPNARKRRTDDLHKNWEYKTA